MDTSEASTSSGGASTLDPNNSSGKGHHRRTSSLWVPPTRSVFSSPSHLFREKAETGGRIIKELPLFRRFFGSRLKNPKPRVIVPNNQNEPPPRYAHPNRKYGHNGVRTTKYSVFTFLPKNLLEQLHRFANFYFIFIVILNMLVDALGAYISILPISFVLGVTAVKDAFEDYRRYKSDRKINHSTCRVWDSSQGRYRKLEWKNIIVGDFVHLSHDEIIPADMLLLRSSDSNGVCYVETANLDGESNLKQRQAIRAMGKFHNATVPLEFSPDQFKYKVVCEHPTTDVYKFEGKLETMEGGPPLPREFTLLAKENVLLRGCVVRNTDFVEGIVLYAGHDTKAMLNNGGPRYKRSSLEKRTNRDIICCVVILLILCFVGAILSGVFLDHYDDPYAVPFFTWLREPLYPGQDSSKLNVPFESFGNFWRFIIVLQVLIPISLYVSIEFIKLGQVWFMSQDMNMYYRAVDKRLQCRALNITEELGQIQYVMSDKTGTLTENQMVFRRCSVAGRDYGGRLAGDQSPDDRDARSPRRGGGKKKPQPSKDRVLAGMVNEAARDTADMDDPIFAFFVSLAICNTVVVNARPHEDLMDPDGDIIDTRSQYEDGSMRSHVIPHGASAPALTVKFLEEVEEETSSAATSPTTTVTSERNAPSTPPESIELIDLSDDKDDAKKSASSDDELKVEKEREKTKEIGKSLPSILQRPSLLNFARLKGFNLSPFRRSVDKRQSAGSDVSPPLQSFYDSESPDELALVEAAKEYGIRLLRRRFDEVVVYLRSSGRSIRFKVLHTLPFDADRKRMSVVVRECTGKKRVFLLTKGADSSVLPIVAKEFAMSEQGEETLFKAQSHLSDYAREGLRTLCIAKKCWSEEDYKSWRSQHEEAELDPHHRENLLLDSTLKAETDIELLGVTAIEDRLQDGVPECIHSLREAGIRVWVLTGDKVETAVNIAYSSRLFSPSMDLLNVGANGVRLVSDLLDEHLKRVNRDLEVTEEAAFGLVLNGSCMDYCMDPHNLERFVQLLAKCRSVLCCRATPLQKSTLVKLAKTKLNGKVLAIGDGANDVSMIQGADVGVGLSGQEGMQAVMASDFAMARFRFLSNLLLVHGHWNYQRLAQTILYFFYKNAMFVFAIFWYQIFCGFSTQVVIDPVYLMIYNLVFTSVPPLIYGCLEQTAPAELLLEYPSLYTHGRLGKSYRWYSFWVNMLDALWQSAVVYWLCHFTYINDDHGLWKFGFVMCAQLLFANTVHLMLMVQYWTWPMFWSLALSIVAYFGISFLYNGFVQPSWIGVTAAVDPPVMVAQQAVADVNFWAVMAMTVVLCMLPRFMFITLRNTIKPSTLLAARRRAATETAKPTATPSVFDCMRMPPREMDGSAGTSSSGGGGSSGKTPPPFMTSASVAVHSTSSSDSKTNSLKSTNRSPV